MSKSHRDMNEFSGPNDVNYQSVVARIAAIVKESKEILAKRNHRKPNRIPETRNSC
jgi:hypothetical protein